MKKFFIISFILISSFLINGCKEQKSTLTIKNFPFKGSGKISIYIDDYSNVSEQTEQKELITNSESIEIWKEPGVFTDEFFELLLNALKSKPQAKRVAQCLSLNLNSPFKLVADDKKSDWVGNGTYTVTIYGADESINKIVKKDVVFTNGSATIDYNDMEIIYKTQKEMEALQKLYNKIKENKKNETK